MKRWCFLLATILSCSFSDAGEPETIELLSSKVILQNTAGYFALSDGSCWKVMGFSPRWRTLSEWWNNIQIVPENYKCLPDDWYIGSQIETYSKYSNLEINIENASNQEDLMQCTHLLVNTRTGQVLFAIAMHPANCIVDLFNDAYKDGYDKGLIEKHFQESKKITDSYQEGYTAGYTKGYTEGYAKAIQP